MNSYFNEVFERLDNLSDEEFDKLLIEAGIDKCPYIEFKEGYTEDIKTYPVIKSRTKINYKFDIDILNQYNIDLKEKVA